MPIAAVFRAWAEVRDELLRAAIADLTRGFLGRPARDDRLR